MQDSIAQLSTEILYSANKAPAGAASDALAFNLAFKLFDGIYGARPIGIDA